jgi:glyoxylase-like metal-dependent hydrolase (beta-lactamase superfamily II)
MLRERVSNNIFVFTSELYAQVTCGAILTPAGAILIDAMPYPSEAKAIARFIEERRGIPVRYVVYTHYHADHIYGAHLFAQARIAGHQLCRRLLDTRGREALAAAKQTSKEMSSVELLLPTIVFNQGAMKLHLGDTSLRLWHAPGHSPDSILCLVEEERILFASDTLMPIPFFRDGSWDDYVATLTSLRDSIFESVVQGHGDVILRGEVQEKVQDDLDYLHRLRDRVELLVKQEMGPEALVDVSIEDCGKSRIPLNGLVQQLHLSNARTLYQRMREGADKL